MTTQDAREAILRVLAEHEPYGGGWYCSCTPMDDDAREPLPASFEAHLADALLAAIPTPAQVVGGLAEVLRDSCHHCGRLPDDDGDHTCPCSLSDSECLEHTADPVVSRNAITAALGGRDA